MYIYIYICICICICICIYIYTYVYVYVYDNMYMYMCIYYIYSNMAMGQFSLVPKLPSPQVRNPSSPSQEICQLTVSPPPDVCNGFFMGRNRMKLMGYAMTLYKWV